MCASRRREKGREVLNRDHLEREIRIGGKISFSLGSCVP
jgi:hypothetical protein